MKKKNLKTLKLNKNSISNFMSLKLAGGSRGCSVGCSLAGGCGTEQPVPTTRSQCCYK